MKKPAEKISPANLPKEMTTELQGLAKAAFDALGLNDFARIDVRMDQEGKPYILEINSMASLGLTGSYVHSAQVAGYTYESLVNRMLDVAAVRYFGELYAQTSEEDDQKTDETLPIRVRVRTYLRSHLATMQDNLKTMVEMNSFVHNIEGVNALGAWIGTRLSQIGFQRQIFPQVEVGNILYFTNHHEEENDLLLLGHLDTSYSYLDFVPFREERGRLYGSGAAESKGGLAIMLAALQALRYVRRLSRRVNCGILLISDDTLGGKFSKKIIEEISGFSKFVLGLKYGNSNGGIVTSCSGRADYQIELTNVKGDHLRTVSDVITAMCQKVTAWQKLAEVDGGVRVKTASVEGRAVFGPTPDFATASLNTNFKEKSQGDRLDKEIRRIGKRGAGTKIRVRVQKGVNRPPVVESEAIKNFFQLVHRLAKRLEVKVQAIHRDRSSDICYVPENIPVLDGMGPIGAEPRTTNEYVIRDSLIDRAALLALIIRECGREGKK